MDKKEVSKKIKQLLNKAGVKARVRGGKGTAYNWIDVWSEDFGRCFTSEEREKIRDVFGIDFGNSNGYVNEIDKWEAIINKIENKNIVETEEYKNLKEKYYNILRKQEEYGSCCLGSGTFIIKDNKKIDFWNNIKQTDSPAWRTSELLKEDFNKLGLNTLHEAGAMD